MNAELEKWIEENSYKFVRLFGGDGEDELCVTVNNLRALFEGKVLVPVNSLHSIMELAGVTLVYQPFGSQDRQHFDALCAAVKEQSDE